MSENRQETDDLYASCFRQIIDIDSRYQVVLFPTHFSLVSCPISHKDMHVGAVYRKF